MADAMYLYFLIKHPTYKEWNVNWYACLCKLCMSSVFSKENSKVLSFTQVPKKVTRLNFGSMSLISQSVDHTSHDAYFLKRHL